MARNDARSSAIMAAGTLVSRILGFVKTILLITVAIGSLSTVGDVFRNRQHPYPTSSYVPRSRRRVQRGPRTQIIKAAKAQDGGARYISKLVTLTVTRNRPHHHYHCRLRLAHHQHYGLRMEPPNNDSSASSSPSGAYPKSSSTASTPSSDRSSTPKTHSVPTYRSPVLQQRHHHPVADPVHLPLRFRPQPPPPSTP